MKENSAMIKSILGDVIGNPGRGLEDDIKTVLDNLTTNLQKEIDSKDSDIKKLTEYLRTMIYYHHHPGNKNWDLIGEAEELVQVIEKGIYGDNGGE